MTSLICKVATDLADVDPDGEWQGTGHKDCVQAECDCVCHKGA